MAGVIEHLRKRRLIIGNDGAAGCHCFYCDIGTSLDLGGDDTGSALPVKRFHLIPVNMAHQQNPRTRSRLRDGLLNERTIALVGTGASDDQLHPTWLLW